MAEPAKPAAPKDDSSNATPDARDRGKSADKSPDNKDDVNFSDGSGVRVVDGKEVFTDILHEGERVDADKKDDDKK